MAHDWNGQIIEEFRANKGQLGGHFADAPMLLLGTTGARTGAARVTPMMYLADGDRVMVFASFAGRPENPAWYHNLTANPQVTVELGEEVYPAVATVLTGEERERIFNEQASRYPGFADYQSKITRQIPVIALTRA